MAKPDETPATPATTPDDLAPSDAGATDADQDDDTSGHSSLTYEYTRLHAQERDREAVAWANREAVRKQSKNPIDRLRGR